MTYEARLCKVWTEIALFDLFQDGGPRKSNVAPVNRAEKSTVRVWTTFNVLTNLKVILKNTISSQKFWKLTVSSREKPFERRSRAYSELSYELASKFLFKRLCANYQFRIVLLSIESFDSWLCQLGKEAKHPLNGAARNHQSISRVICWIWIDSSVITSMNLPEHYFRQLISNSSFDWWLCPPGQPKIWGYIMSTRSSMLAHSQQTLGNVTLVGFSMLSIIIVKNSCWTGQKLQDRIFLGYRVRK